MRTPNHVETRRDVTIYRAQLEIEIELDTSVRNETESRQMLISGKCEPGAYIEVDTPYVEESLYITWRPATLSSSPTLSTSAKTPCASAP